MSSSFFGPLGSACIKAAHRTLAKLTPDAVALSLNLLTFNQHQTVPLKMPKEIVLHFPFITYDYIV